MPDWPLLAPSDLSRGERQRCRYRHDVLPRRPATGELESLQRAPAQEPLLKPHHGLGQPHLCRRCIAPRTSKRTRASTSRFRRITVTFVQRRFYAMGRSGARCDSRARNVYAFNNLFLATLQTRPPIRTNMPSRKGARRREPRSAASPSPPHPETHAKLNTYQMEYIIIPHYSFRLQLATFSDIAAKASTTLCPGTSPPQAVLGTGDTDQGDPGPKC